MITILASCWIIGWLFTTIWGEKRFGPLLWWAPAFILFTWPIGLTSLIWSVYKEAAHERQRRRALAEIDELMGKIKEAVEASGGKLDVVKLDDLTPEAKPETPQDPPQEPKA